MLSSIPNGKEDFRPKLRRWVGWLLAYWLFASVAMADMDLTIKGVDSTLETNIRLHLSAWNTLPVDNIDDIREALNRDIVRALQALGYYHASIDYTLEKQTLLLTINAGEPVTWAKVDIRAVNKATSVDDFNSIISNHPFTFKKAVKHTDYENYKRRLLNTANTLGYLDAQLTRSQLRINTDSNTADVVLEMETGQRYKIGTITTSNSEISASLVNRIIDVKPGEWFDADMVGNIYNQLLESGYFASANIILTKQPPNTANLTIELHDAPEHRVSTGIGYGTDTGPRFKLKWQRPHANSHGNSRSSELQLAQKEQSATTRYRIPYYHPQKRYFSWDTGYRRKKIEDTLTQVATTGLLFHWLRDSGWQYSAGVNLDHERSQVNKDAEDVQTYVIPSAHVSRLSKLGDEDNPWLSCKIWVNLAQSADFLGSDTNFLRLNTGFNAIAAIAPKHNLQLRLDSGGISADDFAQVPVSQRFFTGGDQSIRGYDYETVSPLDESGDLIGGQFFTVASLEYRYRWATNWQTALFVDGGRSYLKDDSFLKDDDSCPLCDTGKDYRSSVGIGLRWTSPVGMLALDIAFPQTAAWNKDKPDNFQVHFYLGAAL